MEYFPSKNNWTKKQPAELGLDPKIINEAVSAAQSDAVSDYPLGVDINEHKALELQEFTEGHDDGKIIGPLKRKGTVNGLVIRHGYVACEFGNTAQVDEIASASKSFIAAIASVAIDDGLIKDLDDPVRNYINDWKFESEHNSTITWKHLLQQTSEWEGTLWGKPDKACRSKGYERNLHKPGAFWEYNDVRVNCLALCLLQLRRNSLPQVLKERIMDPIGATDTWQWHGYFNSDFEIEGKKIKSVAGGAHWGGGIWMNTLDFARFGFLHLRKGNWSGKQLFNETWINTITTPCSENPEYGCLWWLQKDENGDLLSFGAEGGGYHICRVFPKYDLVTVVRWTGNKGFWEFNKKVVEAVIKQY